MRISKYNYTDNNGGVWVDKDTFVVNFAPIVEDGITKHITSEYFKDEKKVQAFIQSYTEDGIMLNEERITDSTLLGIVAITTTALANRYKPSSYETIFVKDNYEVWDAFIDAITNYYVPKRHDNEKAYKLQDRLSNHIMQLLNELDKEYKING